MNAWGVGSIWYIQSLTLFIRRSPYTYLAVLLNILLRTLIRIEVLETYFRELLNRARLTLRDLPGLAHYKMLGRLTDLYKICEILDSLNLPFLVVGGIAYDAKQGRLTRHHTDLDLAVLVNNPPEKLRHLLQSAGFRLRQHGTNWRLNKSNTWADIFFWQEIDDTTIEKLNGDTLVRMPRSFFTPETASLCGYEFQVASNDYIIGIEPFAEKAISKAYIQSLKEHTFLPVEYTRVQIARTVECYEFAAPAHNA